LVELALATTRDVELRSDLLLMRGTFTGLVDPHEGRRQLLTGSEELEDASPETAALLAAGAAFSALAAGTRTAHSRRLSAPVHSRQDGPTTTPSYRSCSVPRCSATGASRRPPRCSP